ncbi:DUF732 domain-containing protein [Mycobacterium sp. HUMS_1102779]|uniref:DUF732 domain-containing protein n=1 Tax=Mycobacterium sp. HUMS_1102779 TaxID=3383487 RepID=UPI00389A7C01
MMSLRRLAALSAPVFVGIALLPTPAPALADAAGDSDDTFLAQMHRLGFTWPAGEDAPIVALGTQICAERKDGKTPDSISQDIHSALGSRTITFPDVTSMVSAAESNYCPE